MQDPIEKLQETEAFQQVDRKVNWAHVVVFGTVGLLIVIGITKNVILA